MGEERRKSRRNKPEKGKNTVGRVSWGARYGVLLVGWKR